MNLAKEYGLNTKNWKKNLTEAQKFLIDPKNNISTLEVKVEMIDIIFPHSLHPAVEVYKFTDGSVIYYCKKEGELDIDGGPYDYLQD